jgi:foldase protein PrsA
MAARAKRSTAARKTASTSKLSKSPVKKLTKNAKKVKDEVMSSPLIEETVSDVSTTAKKAGNRKTLLLLVSLAVVLGLLYYFKDLFVVATVNGKPITRFEIINELEKKNGKDVVDNLVTKNLIMQEAAKKGVTVSQDDVNNELAKIEEDLKTQGQTLDQVLQMQGLSKADVEENLRIKLYIERLLADEVTVSDDDAKKYFDENKAMYPKDQKFEEIKTQIQDQLKQQKLQEKFQTWLNDLKANAKINYFKTY